MKMGSHTIEENYSLEESKNVVARIRHAIEQGDYIYIDMDEYINNSIDVLVKKTEAESCMYGFVLADLLKLKKEFDEKSDMDNYDYQGAYNAYYGFDSDNDIAEKYEDAFGGNGRDYLGR